jgi:hypothetical protein
VHWLTEGHATANRKPPLSIFAGVGLPGELGLNVTSRPELSTAVHWLSEGHATASSEPPLSIVVGVGLPGEVGLNVTSRPE